MTRTYLKSSSSLLIKKPPDKDTKTKAKSSVRGIQTTTVKTDWRGKPQLDDSLDSPEIVFKSKKSRKLLQVLGTLNNPSLFSDNSTNISPDLLSLRRSVVSEKAAAADDTFDKLFENVPEKVDPFDKLFENVDKKTPDDTFDKLLTDISPHHPSTNRGLYSSVFSTPNESEDFSTDTSNQPGLFSSFSKQTEEKTPKLKRLKSNRNVRTKKPSVKNVSKPRDNLLSETLVVQIKFEGDTKPGHQPQQISSLTTLPLPSPTRGRGLTTLSVATSTPVLSSKLSVRALSSESSSGPSMTLSPVQDVQLEDDVFLRRLSTLSTSSPPPNPVSRSHTIPSDDFYDPTPQKSFVNKSRGNRKFGGPAASLMNHIGWKFSMATIPIQLNSSSTSIHESSLLQSVREDEVEEMGEVTVNLDCVCGNNQMTSSYVIQCDHCGMWFHTDCVQLSETCIEELEREELDWFCPKCIDEAVNNPDITKNFTLSTPFKPAESSYQICSPEAPQVVPEVCKAGYLSPPLQPSVLSPITVTLDDSIISPISTNSLQGSISPRSLPKPSYIEQSQVQSSEKPPFPPPSPNTSLLSLTAQLEKHHLASTETLQDASLMFVKPAAPPTKRQARKARPTEDEEVQIKPGKSWRRSLCQAKRTFNLACNFTQTRLSSLAEVKLSSSTDEVLKSREATNIVLKNVSRLESLPSVEFIDPTPIKQSSRKTCRLDPILSEDVLFPTPQKILFNPSLTKQRRSSRTSFCVVPATPRQDKLRGGRHSVLHQLSETLLTEKQLSETLLTDSPLTIFVEQTAVEKLLAACTKKEILPFNVIYSPDVMEGSKKVGEGAFGEVFLLGSEGEDRPVLKVVPIDGDIPVNGENQTTVEDMLSEVIISNSLSKLRAEASNVTAGFVEVRGCHVFVGEYPPQLLGLWDEYDKEHKSENDRPDNLPAEQKFIALEFNNGGRDLEKYTFKNATQALQAWKQVVHTLAVAEEELQFEHRDLHWGNVLVKETKEKFVNFTLGGDTYQVETGGVLTTIIDFSLSRLSMDKVTIFNNLSQDPSLFTAKGNDQQGGDYQFDIYRKMKDVNGNNWEPFQPKTNILWLDYMLDKMTTEVYYSAKKTTKPHKSGMGKIRSIRSSLVDNFACAADWVRREGDRVD